MGDFDDDFIHTLAMQSWSLYGVGMFLILLRMYARIHRLGFKGLQTDDYIMALAACLYTLLIISLNVISAGGGSNLYAPEDFATFTPQDIQDRIQGSKIVIVSEQAMLNVIYAIKSCMLIMYTRLTLGLTANRLVYYLAGYVAVGYIASQIAFFTICIPFSGYWAMPPPNPQCSTLTHYSIVQGCFNISADILMLFIPLPLITKLSMPLKQKAILMIIFSLGGFVIVAAILNKVFNLTNIWSPNYMLWYTRESSVAVYVSNLPLIWPLLREVFPKLKSLTPGQKSSNSGSRLQSGLGGSFAAKPRSKTGGGRHLSGKVTTTIRGIDSGDSTENLGKGTEMGIISRNESETSDYGSGIYVVGGGNEVEKKGLDEDLRKGGILMSTTVHISEQVVDEHVKDREDGEQPPGIRLHSRDVEKGLGWMR